MEMREIKFRAWDAVMDFMVDVDYYKIDFKGQVFFDNDDKSLYNQTDKLILMQYTDLKDKNNVEIYESDLLKIEMDWGYGLAEIIIKVYFENGSFRAKALNSHEDTFLLELPYLEVIGNIYENPELLRED